MTFFVGVGVGDEMVRLFTTCLHHLALLTPTDSSKHSPKRSLGVSHDNGRSTTHCQLL